MKKVLLVVILLLLLATTACTPLPPDKWTLIHEGVLVKIGEIEGRTTLHFNDGTIFLLWYGYHVYFPDIVKLGTYYYVYKESAGATWNGYHIVTKKVGE